MIIAAHQPGYFPSLEILQEVAGCDLFVVMDNVQINRNSFQGRTMIREEDGVDDVISWAEPATRIHDLVRDLHEPLPGAVKRLGADRIVVRRARPVPGPGSPGAWHGKVLEGPPGRTVVRCGDGALEALRLDAPGRTGPGAAEALRESVLRPGDRPEGRE